jgi:hypothetical protein
MFKRAYIFQSIILPLSLISSGFSFSSSPLLSDQSAGSGMTNDEEALAISQDLATGKLIQQSSSIYALSLIQYKNGSLTWAQLQEAHDKAFSNLTSAIKLQITTSSQEIHAIASDYDKEHELDYDQHIQQLLGLAQKNLGITAEKVFLPPLPSKDTTYPNLITGGSIPSQKNWPLASGSGSLVNGQIITDSPNGASFSQEVLVTPGHWYLISGNIDGASEGKDKYGNDNVFSGTITVIHANADFPQSSDELDEGGLHRRYFWAQAADTSMTLYLKHH